MNNRLSIQFLVSSLCIAACGVAHASPEDDLVSKYLKSHSMTNLLEVQLEDRIADTSNANEIESLSHQLSDLYIEQLQSMESDDPYRLIIMARAQSLIERMPSASFYELRLELHIRVYLEHEQAVELARLELLKPEERQGATKEFRDVKTKLKRLSHDLDIEIVQLDRQLKNASGEREAALSSTMSDLRRYRSLSHYYHAWSGYSIAVLSDQHVPSDVFVSFGWLVGGEGELPQLSSLNESTLEFDHVGRAAIGIGLAYAQSDEHIVARTWVKVVADSVYSQKEVQQSARQRQLQVLAIAGDWLDTHRLILAYGKLQDETETMSVADARFLALRSLEALDTPPVGRGGEADATSVARYAIGQLVEQGEIGHVLDLHSRFKNLPILADSFVTRYAQAINALNRAEQTGEAQMYAVSAPLFSQALSSEDADRFPKERDDCSLKLAYIHVRSGHANDAIKICNALIDISTQDEVIEEARWLLIAALETKGRKKPENLDLAVREYILSYPNTHRSAKLLLRHAMRGTVDTAIAQSTLLTIDENDPMAVPARRILIQLLYDNMRASGFGNQKNLGEILEHVQWVYEKEPSDILDERDAASRIATIRVGIYVSLRLQPIDLEFARQLMERWEQASGARNGSQAFQAEYLHRAVQISLLDERYDEVDELIQKLDALDPARADGARVLVLNDSITRWRSSQSTALANRIVRIGVPVLAKQMPPFPDPMRAQLSAVVEVIAESALYLWEQTKDDESLALAQRMANLVLDRGQPTISGLIRTAYISKESHDSQRELDSWLRLLAAYPASSEPWYEARYQSLRIMRLINPKRAQEAFDQYIILHPNGTETKWGKDILNLFGAQP